MKFQSGRVGNVGGGVQVLREACIRVRIIYRSTCYVKKKEKKSGRGFQKK